MLIKPGIDRTLFASPTLWLILINVGVWIFLGLQGVDWMSPSPDDLTAWGGNLGPYTLTGEWQRLLYSMFLHGGALHLGLNMFLLSQIGPLSEAVWGRTRFALIYLLSGLFGGLASAWWYANAALRSMDNDALQLSLGFAPTISTTVSIGASGALLGASGALLVHALRAGDEAKIELKVIFQVVALNVGMGFLMTGTDNAAHVGGALAGMAIGALLMLPGDVVRIGRKAQSAAVFVVGLLVLGALVKLSASEEVTAVASTLRAADAEEARRAAEQARRDKLDALAQEERAALPAPVSIEEASGTSVTIAGRFASRDVRLGADAWYVADGSSNRVGRLDPATLQLDKQWKGPPLPPHNDPNCSENFCYGFGATGVAGARDGTWAMVGSMVPDAVSRLDLSTGSVLWSVKVAPYPRAVFLSENEKYAFAVHGPENTLSVIDIAKQTVLGASPIGEAATSLPLLRPIGAVQGQHILYLADTEQHTIHAIATEAPGKLTKVYSTGKLAPHLLALSGDKTKLFVSGPGGMQIVDTRTLERIDELFTCAHTEIPRFAVNYDGNWIAVNADIDEVHVISIPSQRVVRVLPSPALDNALRFSADGKALYMLGRPGYMGTNSVFRRTDLSRTLDVAATVEVGGEYFCRPDLDQVQP